MSVELWMSYLKFLCVIWDDRWLPQDSYNLLQQINKYATYTYVLVIATSYLL